MNSRLRSFAPFLIALFFCSSLFTSQPIQAQEHLTAPLTVSVPAPPWAFQANGKWHLVYELHIANLGSEDCTITQIEVVASDPERRLASFAGTDLDALMTHPNADVPATPAKIPPAGFAVVYMWVTVDGRAQVPSAIRHKISMKAGNSADNWLIDAQAVTVNRDPVPLIGPPLRGAGWAAAEGPSNQNHHRRGLLPIDGHPYIGERFAIDWARITPEGEIYSGDPANNRNYPGYGVDVLAVANGTVIEIKDGIPENTPGSNSTAVPMTMETLAGNYILLQIGRRLSAVYAHLQPGSIRVKTGDTVRQGQVLGRLGNSGSSGAPHLHFHICDGKSVFACEGVPYAFKWFAEESKNFPASNSSVRSLPERIHLLEIPTFETLVRFPD